MRIAEFETIPVHVGLRRTYRSSRVRQGVGVRNVIVKLVADTGAVGWGESCGLGDPASIEAALTAMKPYVLGRDPWDGEAIARDVYRRGLWEYRIQTGNLAFAGIDMALWDLCGKECGRPLYQLFGGAVRPEVDYFFFLAEGTPEDIAEQCREGMRQGYGCYYLKVGVDVAAEEDILAIVRETVGPAGKLRVDANEAWSLPEAARILNRWNDRFGIDFAEAPVRAFPERLMASLRRMTPVALCANEGLGSEADVLRTIAAGGADVLCFSSYWVGSLRRFYTLSHLAHLSGIGVCKHTHGEFGIGAAAAHHMLLTLPNVVDGSQQTATIMLDDLLQEELPIAAKARWGRLDRPGLGVEIDEDKLRRLNRSYVEEGARLSYNLQPG
jgi:glucarate dehydratase